MKRLTSAFLKRTLCWSKKCVWFTSIRGIFIKFLHGIEKPSTKCRLPTSQLPFIKEKKKRASKISDYYYCFFLNIFLLFLLQQIFAASWVTSVENHFKQEISCDALMKHPNVEAIKVSRLNAISRPPDRNKNGGLHEQKKKKKKKEERKIPGL